MSGVVHRFLYVMFPRRCRQCGTVVAFDEDCCKGCRTEERITGKTCPKCGRNTDGCVCKKQHFSPGYKAVCAPYYYRDSIKEGIERLKSEGFTELVPCMADAMTDTILERFHDVTFDTVTFIPMRYLRRYRRGYNQAQLLAEAVAGRLGIPCEALLKKTKHTHSQRRSTASRRRVNLYGAFDVTDAPAVKGKTILLVDDVKTTGATLSECAATLRMYGAKTVYAAAYAVTEKKK